METQIVIFELSKQKYGLPINQVKEIINTPSITKVPQSELHIEGIITLRNTLLPIVNLAKLLELSTENTQEPTKIIVTDFSGHSFGIMVDKVNEIVKTTINFSLDNTEKLNLNKQNFIAGVIEINQNLIMLLDLDNFIKNKRQQEAC